MMEIIFKHDKKPRATFTVKLQENRTDNDKNETFKGSPLPPQLYELVKQRKMW